MQNISLKSEKEILVMREGGKKLAGIMDELKKLVKPGISALEIDKLAEKLVFDNGGVPSFKGYKDATNRKFPAVICASLNDEVVHGIPRAGKILKEGDILKIDIGMLFKGYHTDMARTFPVGKVSPDKLKLIAVTEESFWQGIKKLKAGKMLSDYSKTAQKVIEANGFSVVRNLVGHGIGKKLHEDPPIPNYWNKKYQDVKLLAGMTLALEPMVNANHFETIIGSDGWVFKTKDGSLSAHYENTVLITEKGVEVLTNL